MPKLTRNFFQKLNGNNIELQLLIAKQNGVTPMDFFQKMSSEIVNGELNEDSIIKALKLNSYIKLADNANNELLRNHDPNELKVYVSLNDNLIKKYLSSQQLDKIYEAMEKDSVGMIESIEEDGNIELTKEAIQQDKEQRELEALKQKEIEEEEKEIIDLKNQAKEEINNKIQERIKKEQTSFNKDLMNGKSKEKVFFDKSFFQKMFDDYNPEMFGNNNGVESPYEQIKTSVNGSIKGLDKDKTSPGKQREVARNMLKIYMSLRNGLESKSFSEKLRNPINSLKEWGQKRKIENAIKNAYGFNGKTMDLIYNMSKCGIPEDLGYLKKDGSTVANRGSDAEFDRKFDELNKLRIARKKSLDIVKDDATLMKKLSEDTNYSKGKEQISNSNKIKSSQLEIGKQNNINITKD